MFLKEMYCKMYLKADQKHIKFAIDDSPKHALEYAKHGIECHVPVKSYNKQTQNVKNIKRYKIF